MSDEPNGYLDRPQVDRRDLWLMIDAAFQPLIGIEADYRHRDPELAAKVWSVVEELQRINRVIDP